MGDWLRWSRVCVCACTCERVRGTDWIHLPLIHVQLETLFKKSCSISSEFFPSVQKPADDLMHMVIVSCPLAQLFYLVSASHTLFYICLLILLHLFVSLNGMQFIHLLGCFLPVIDISLLALQTYFNIFLSLGVLLSFVIYTLIIF